MTTKKLYFLSISIIILVAISIAIYITLNSNTKTRLTNDSQQQIDTIIAVSYTHPRAHETVIDISYVVICLNT